MTYINGIRILFRDNTQMDLANIERVEFRDHRTEDTDCEGMPLWSFPLDVVASHDDDPHYDGQWIIRQKAPDMQTVECLSPRMKNLITSLKGDTDAQSRR